MPSIISLEGAPCAGKTTLRNHLEYYFKQNSYLNISYFPNEEDKQRYAIEMPKSYPKDFADARKNETWYFNHEMKKMQKLKENSAGSECIIIERDYLSTLAFSYAYSLFSGIQSYQEFYNKFRILRIRKDLVQPNLRILLNIKANDSSTRQRIRSKKTNSLFTNTDFLSNLTEYYPYFYMKDEPQNTVIINSTKTPEDICYIARNLIEELYER